MVILTLSAGAFALLFVLATLAAPDGADANRYVDWARAFWTGDPFSLQSQTFSPTGMPLSQWSHGPGLLATPLFGLFDDWTVRVTGLLLTLGTIGFVVATLRVVTRGDRSETLFLSAVALIGTHAGFYTIVHSSESYSYFPAAAMLYIMVSRTRFRARDAFVLGCLSYLLMLVRVQLAIYCVPMFVWLTWTVLEQEGFRSFASIRRALWILLAAALPPAAALLQGKALYRLMLGASKSSPYVFGGHGFSSFNIAKPEFKAVLLHAWHGLLPYHPLYIVVFGCFVQLLLAQTHWKKRVVVMSVMAAMALHLAVQSAWFVWWLGTGTFGMRGLSVWFIVAVPALAPLLKSRVRVALVGTVTLACLWSYLLLVRTAAPPVYVQFYTFRALLDGQVASFDQPASRALLYALATACITGYALRHCAAEKRILSATASGLLSLYAFYLIEVNTLNGAPLAAWFSEWRSPLRHVAAVLVAAGSTVFTLQTERAPRDEGVTAPAWTWQAVTGVALAAIVFVASNALFYSAVGSMADKRVAYDASRYPFCGTLQIEEMDATYTEYLRVPAFKAKKASFKHFLDHLDRHACSEATNAP